MNHGTFSRNMRNPLMQVLDALRAAWALNTRST